MNPEAQLAVDILSGGILDTILTVAYVAGKATAVLGAAMAIFLCWKLLKSLESWLIGRWTN